MHMYAVIDKAGRATFPVVMSAIIPAFHHLWGSAPASSCAEQIRGTTSLK